MTDTQRGRRVTDYVVMLDEIHEVDVTLLINLAADLCRKLVLYATNLQQEQYLKVKDSKGAAAASST